MVKQKLPKVSGELKKAKPEMVRRKLSMVLDELNKGKLENFWHARLVEMQLLLKERKYSALERRIQDLLESDRATGRIKPPKSGAQGNSSE